MLARKGWRDFRVNNTHAAERGETKAMILFLASATKHRVGKKIKQK